MMTTEDKQKLFDSEYAMYGWDFTNIYKFMGLVGALYVAARKKDPELTVYGLLKKLEPSTEGFNKLFEITQYHIMSHLYWTDTEFPTFGLKSAKDIASNIRVLLNTFLPF